MIPKSKKYRTYHPAAERYLKPAIVNFFEREFPSTFGPVVRENIADELIKIFKQLSPPASTITHGQVLWNTLDKSTRPGSPNRKYIPVVLTIISEDDIKQLEKGVSITEIRKNAIARMINEAYKQGGILSMRDISLILLINDTHSSFIRKKYEIENNVILPHVGSIHDVGNCTTHKTEIIYKAIIQRKDPSQIAYETNHSQRAVDRYLNDFYRVKMLYKDKHDMDYICNVTHLSKNLVKQYIKIIEDYG